MTSRTSPADVTERVMRHVRGDPMAHPAMHYLLEAGGEPYVVGGAVRDAVLDKRPADVDVLVRGLTLEHAREALARLPGATRTVGKAFGVIEHRGSLGCVQVALPRREHSIGAGHRDFEVSVEPSMPIEDDLERREFTCNAMAVSWRAPRLIDPFFGREDTQLGVLRTTAHSVFLEDPLRTIRALVVRSRHGLRPDPLTRLLMRQAAPGIGFLPPDRIGPELDKLMAGAEPAAAIRLAHETGVLRHFLPEVDDMFGFDQRSKYHDRELGDHVMTVLDRICTGTTDADLRLAALLHDVGKPESQWFDDEGHGHYYRSETGVGEDHEDVGALTAREILTRLRFPRARVDRVVALVRNHMYVSFTTQQGARRFLARVGDHAEDLMLLRWADQESGKVVSDFDPDRNRELVELVRSRDQAFSRRHLAIGGRDLLELGMQPGPSVGATLDSLVEMVIDDPSLNEREWLLAIATWQIRERA